MRNASTLRPPPVLPIRNSFAVYPIQRIFCVGRNYAAHAREMGMDEREPPFFFTKWAETYSPSGEDVAYPPATSDFQHEIELVVALTGGGSNLKPSEAEQWVFGYAAGLDMTRRDIQTVAREKGRPWDAGKNFDQAAPIGPLVLADEAGLLRTGRITLSVNREVRQSGDLSELIWTVPEIIAELSRLYALRAGDVIMTGTPAGVGPVSRGDKLEGMIEGVGAVNATIV